VLLIGARQNARHGLMKSKTRYGANCGSDHNPVTVARSSRSWQTNKRQRSSRSEWDCRQDEVVTRVDNTDDVWEIENVEIDVNI